MKNLWRYSWIIMLIVLGAAAWSIYGTLSKRRSEVEAAELAQREADFQSEGNTVPSSLTDL